MNYLPHLFFFLCRELYDGLFFRTRTAMGDEGHVQPPKVAAIQENRVIELMPDDP